MAKNLEHIEQVALMELAGFNLKRHPELKYLHAIPNGGHRHISVAVALKKEGVKSGAPDLFLDVARGGFHGFRAELKVKGGELSDNQEDWILFLRGQGYHADVYFGWESIKNALVNYLNLPSEA